MCQAVKDHIKNVKYLIKSTKETFLEYKRKTSEGYSNILELTDKNLFKTEREVHKLSDLPMEWFTFKNVYVGSFEGEPVYIRTVIVKNNPRKPKLVMMHGYGTASALFYQCTKSLVKYF